jgi:tryptophan-associated transmembrane protein
VSASFVDSGPSYSRQLVKNHRVRSRMVERSSSLIPSMLAPAAGRAVRAAATRRSLVRPPAGATLPAMPTEILSTARPSRLRLLGFVALVVGALLAGLGATLTWATVGFPNDTRHLADVAFKGVDVWEGVVALVIAAAALVALIVMRVARSSVVRLGIAVALAIGGLVVAGLAVLDVATARERFGGIGQLDQIARKMATFLGQTVGTMRALLEKNVAAALRVDVGSGLWITLAGGVLLVVAGVLSFLWARERASAPAVSLDAGVAMTETDPVAGSEDPPPT